MLRLQTLFVLAALGSGTAASASPTTDFLDDAIKGDNSEVKLGRLAVEKGVSEKVRAYGKMLEADHGAHREKLVAIARPLKLNIPDGMTAGADVEYVKLKLLTGASFDKEFASHMVKDHQEDIAKYEKEAARGDSATAGLAKATIPTLRKHLEMAQKLTG